MVIPGMRARWWLQTFTLNRHAPAGRPLVRIRARQDHDDEGEESALRLQQEGVICLDGSNWDRLDLRCAISMMPLTDPAMGSACRHRGSCDYQTLRRWVGRVCGSQQKVCPMAGCSAPLARTRDVLRDEKLRAALRALPSLPEAVWVRGDEVLTQNPAQR